MMLAATRNDARRAIASTLAADTATDATAFDANGITVVEYRQMPGRRRFDPPPRPYQVMTMGHGLVISCHRDWMEWSRRRARSVDRIQFFAPANIAAIVALLAESGHELVGPHTSYGCSADTLRDVAPPPGITLDVIRGPSIEALRPAGAFPNALPPRANPLRPDMLGVTATSGDIVVACAAASADCDLLWQIGVDVLEAHQGRGIGRATVGCLTKAILAAGKVPYYSHSVSNIPSASLAVGLGYWPAWVQMYAQEAP
jgi:GNAT superfamily N-acetyltransferase